MVDKPYTLDLENETATLALGAAVARHVPKGLTVYLHGDLGAGKTTWVRGFLHGLGHRGAVKSPTYTLVEAYSMTTHQVYHFDLYRLSDAEELEFIGIRDYLRDDTVCLIEWPERGQPLLREPDLELWLTYNDQGGRSARLEAWSEKGQSLLQHIKTER
ncbi:MAG: tRNA (adenosine(37)-N6)-threonylcarbamoyltransferase complex ATPase subunit type 1 TsaE [Gammaproteobacteria bacterium]|nr:tRNA (adenosine(37)-N6)-threonylcarbamoyltransferase complex ATPase subunit type 1 TsaE [Gammaproteobacteria bacterium]